MKILIFLLCLLFATPSYAGMVIGSGAAGCTSVTVDLWETFQEVPSTGSWTLVDANSRLSASSSAEQATLSCPNGTPDTGTNGMAYSCTDGNIAHTYYTIASAKSAVSWGIWIKTGAGYEAWGGQAVVFQICQTAGCATGWTNYFTEGRSTGDNSRIFKGPAGNTIGISDTTWYWFTVNWARNAISSWALYDTSGIQVGTTKNFTGFDATATTLDVGVFSKTGGCTTGAMWDDLIVDWTDQTFPLGP